jgi:phosphoglycolate phosphatase
LATACNHILALFGFRTIPIEEYRLYVGDGARNLVSRAARLRDDDPRLDEIVETYVRHYASHPIEKTQWMPYATDTLDQLASIPLAISTNKPRAVTDVILKALGVENRFALVVGGGDVKRPTPAPDSLRLIAEKLGMKADELVMVGDGTQDVLCGKSVGARTIAVSTGYASETSLRELMPDALIKNLRTVPDTVNRWTK